MYGGFYYVVHNLIRVHMYVHTCMYVFAYRYVYSHPQPFLELVFSQLLVSCSQS